MHIQAVDELEELVCNYFIIIILSVSNWQITRFCFLKFC